ncbi:unnamed protein product, partial [Leptidea sinapis]
MLYALDMDSTGREEVLASENIDRLSETLMNLMVSLVLEEDASVGAKDASHPVETEGSAHAPPDVATVRPHLQCSDGEKVILKTCIDLIQQYIQLVEKSHSH